MFEKINHGALRLPPYHPDFNPIEMTWTAIKVAAKNVNWNVSQTMELIREKVNWKGQKEWSEKKSLTENWKRSEMNIGRATILLTKWRNNYSSLMQLRIWKLSLKVRATITVMKLCQVPRIITWYASRKDFISGISPSVTVLNNNKCKCIKNIKCNNNVCVYDKICPCRKVGYRNWISNL